MKAFDLNVQKFEAPPSREIEILKYESEVQLKSELS